MSHHRIDIQNLTYTYPDRTPALQDVAVQIRHGESVALIGANGAGKSTLLLHLVGILEPTAGAVRIGDLPLTRNTLPAVRRSVGMVFQNPDDQLFMPTVAEDVAFGPQNMGLPPAEVDERVHCALAQVGMVHLAERPPFRLSPGQKRAVAIATVLAMQPDILVLDEPSASLDPQARKTLVSLLQTFSHTKIIATHDLDLAREVCPRMIVLHAGRIAADGDTGALLADQALLQSCLLA